MKRYKLLKELPTFKAGDTFVLSDDGCLYLDDLPGKNGQHWKANVMAYHRNTLMHFPNILKDWFKEIESNNIWRPVSGDKYWMIGNDGKIFSDVWCDWSSDLNRFNIGNCFRTEEEARKILDKLMVLMRLRKNNFTFDEYGYDGEEEMIEGEIYFSASNYDGAAKDLRIVFGGEK